MNSQRSLIRMSAICTGIWLLICGLLTYYAASDATLDPSVANRFFGLTWNPEKVKFFALFTFIPPVALFALGWAALWAAKRLGRSG